MIYVIQTDYFTVTLSLYMLIVFIMVLIKRSTSFYRRLITVFIRWGRYLREGFGQVAKGGRKFGIRRMGRGKFRGVIKL